MKKDVFKRLIFVGLLMTVLGMILSLCVKVDANTYNKYVVDVKSKTSGTSNDDFQVSRNIVDTESTNREVTLQTSIKNVRSVTQYQDIAILIDTSYSMDVNSNLDQVKAKAIDFVQNLYNLSGGTQARVSIYTTGAAVSPSKVTINSYADFTTLQNYINSITKNGSGYSLDDGINRVLTASASNGFEYGNTNVTKYMMIFTDATDDAEQTIQSEADNNDTQFILVSTGGITNSQYGTRDSHPAYLRGLYDLATMDNTEITQDIKGTIINFSYEDIFSDLVKNCFTFTPLSITLNDGTSISTSGKVGLNTSSTGYKWTIDKLSAQQTITLKWKIDLKDDSTVSTQAMALNKQTVLYNEIATNTKGTLSYSSMYGDQTLDLTASPTIEVCETYSISVQAVDVNNTSKDISGVQFQVKAVNQVTGETIYSGTETSGSDGKITVGGFKETDPVVFTVIPTVSTLGYESPEGREFTVTNTYHTASGPKLTVQGDSDLQYSVDDAARDVLITIPVSPQGFNFELKVTDADGITPITNAKFKLIAPKVNSYTEMDVLTGTTDSQGYFCFRPNVMTQDGEYMFYLTEISTEDGYTSAGNVTVYITFQGGVVKSITKYYNDKVTATRVSGDTVKLDITNQSDNVDKFNFKLHLSDSADATIPVKDAEYQIQLRRASDGSTKDYGVFKTDDVGDINLQISGTGLLELVITEVEPNGAYIADSKAKLVDFTRQAGILTAGSYSAGCQVDVSTINLIKVSLQSTKKSEQNVFRVQLVDGSDSAVEIPDGIGVTVTNVTSGTPYDEQYTLASSGYVDVYIPTNLPVGGYEFTISIDSSTVPTWYTVPAISRVRVDIGTNGFIQDESALSGAVKATSVTTESEGSILKHVGTAQIVLLLGDTDNNTLTITTAGAIDKELIPGAKYDIDIQFGASYTLERKITGRLTDANGHISTILPSSEQYYITVTQTSVPAGYKLDKIPQEFTLSTNGTKLAHSEDIWETPRTGDSANYGSGGSIINNGTELHYDHFIQPITVEDTYFDMDLSMYEQGQNPPSDDLPIQGQYIYAKTDMITVDGVEKGIVMADTGTPLKETLGPTDNNGDIYTPEISNNGPRYRVKGMKQGEEEQFTVYLYQFQTAATLDQMTGKNGNNPEDYLDTSSLVKLEITFRYNENKQIIGVTNFTIVKGNKFVRDKNLDGSLTYNGYESLIKLSMYADVSSVGNFSLDLTKKNIDGSKVLNGAKYDITVTKPSGVTFVEKDQIITDSSTGNGYELPGLLLTAGTTIEIRESQAPIGYDLSPETELMTITSVNDETGQIEYTLAPSSLTTPRMKVTGTDIVSNADGTMKTEIFADLYDEEENTFNVGIKTIDSNTSSPVAGFDYKVVTSTLAEAITPDTAADGTTTVKVGAQYKDEKIKYTITPTKIPQYYKNLVTPVVIEVTFDSNGIPTSYTDVNGNENVDWKMITLPSANNGIDIEMLTQKQDPLTVKITTIDDITGSKVTDAAYTITPSKELDGKSVLNSVDNTADVKVGYTQLGGTTEYEIDQTSTGTGYKYKSIAGHLNFKVNYDSKTADVTNAVDSTTLTTDHPTSEISKISWTGKTVNIEIRIQPKQGINIVNKDYFSGLNIYGAQFQVSVINGSQVTPVDSEAVGGNGSAILYADQLGNNSVVKYKVEQVGTATSASMGQYAKVDSFELDVTYNSNREITSANIVGGNTKWAAVTITQPSYNYSLGYNGNQKGIVNIEIKNYPAMRFEIKVKDQLDNSKVIGNSSYAVASTIPTTSGTVTTALSTGATTAYLDKSLVNSSTTYTVNEVKANDDYQAMLSDIQVFVQFDSNGYINNVTGVTSGSWYTVKADTANPADPTSYFRVFLEIQSIPKFRININDQDRVTNAAIQGTKYCSDQAIDATSGATSGVYTNTSGQTLEVGTTNTQGNTTVRVLKSNKDTTMQFTVKEISTVTGYQELEQDIIVEIQFNPDGTVKTTKVVQGGNYASTTMIATPSNTFDKMSINLAVKNYKVMDVQLKTVADGTTNPIQNIKYSAQAKLKDTGEVLITPDDETTDVNGDALFRFKKALSGKTVVYTFKQVTKAPGFDWIESQIDLEVQYGADGKVYAITDSNGNRTQVLDGNGNVIGVAGVKIATGTGFTAIANIDIDGFKINLTVQDTEIKEFNISMNVVDKYDQTKFLEGGNYHAYLADATSSSKATVDKNYDTTLVSGRDSNNDGVPDIGYGKDEQIFGKYISNSQTGDTRYLVIRQTGYTDASGNYQNGTPTEYVKGGKTVQSKYASQESYSILIKVQFDYEGKITSAENVAVAPDSIDNTLSYLLDSRYVTISHSTYNISVNLNYYPLAEFQVVTENAFDGNEYLNASYDISTRAMTPYSTIPASEFIESGYVGHSQTYGYNSAIYGQYLNTMTYNSVAASGENQKTATDDTVKIEENGKTRTFYVYASYGKGQIPSNYQRYSNWYPYYYRDNLLGTITVTYNDVGEIKTTTWTEDGLNNNISNHNIPESMHVDLGTTEDNRTIKLTVKYAPTTSFQVQAIDNVTKAGLSSIRVAPFNSATPGHTETRWEYYTGVGYFDTAASGWTSQWQYWGANKAGQTEQFKLDTSFGSSGSAYTRYYSAGTVTLDVTYGSNGKIAKVVVTSTDQFGDPNATATTDGITVKVVLLINRKFMANIGKVDAYSLENVVGSKFTVYSERLTTPIATDLSFPDTELLLGKIEPGKTIKYTFIETQQPYEYLKRDTFALWVTFNNDGTIQTVETSFDTSGVNKDTYVWDSTNAYHVSSTTSAKQDRVIEPYYIAAKNTGVVGIKNIDLAFSVKDIKTFKIDIELQDKYYTNEKLAGGTFEVYNTINGVKTDEANGTIITDSNGKVTSYVGPVYPGKTVTYTIIQKNIISGYYENTETAEITVKFNASGKIDSYTTNGVGLMKVDTTKFVGQQYIDVIVNNIPKDVRIGIYKFDKTTKAPISNVEFTVARYDTSTDPEQFIDSKVLTTDVNGVAVDVIDQFTQTANGRTIEYKVTETKKPDSYRANPEMDFKITYDASGQIQFADVGTSGYVAIPLSGSLKVIGNNKVQMALNVPNDNSYSLAINDQDTDKAGLGIEGSKYNVSINNVSQGQLVTDTNGQVSLNDRTEVGAIKFDISEASAGEGYEGNSFNKLSFIINKGTQNYTLDLNTTDFQSKYDVLNVSNPGTDITEYLVNLKDTNSNVVGTALLRIDENLGVISVTFKNASRFELTLYNADINTGDLLQGAQFDISIVQCSDLLGTEVAGTSTTITTPYTDTIGSSKSLYYDLGITHYSEILKFKFVQKTAPTGYNKITDQNFIIQFDQNGRVAQIIPGGYRVQTDVIGNSHSLITTLKNGTQPPQFTVKVIKSDSETNNRLDNVEFNLGITNTDTSKVLLEDTKITTGDRVDKATNRVIEKGISYTTVPVTSETDGNISIKLDETKGLLGYDQSATTSSGEIKLNAQITPIDDYEDTVALTLVDNAGFNVTVDTANRLVTVKVLNQPAITLNVVKEQAPITDTSSSSTSTTPAPTTTTKIPGVKFDVTSIIQGRNSVQKTDLAVTTNATNTEGKSSSNIGKPYAGQSVIYTLQEEPLEGYDEIEPIQVLVMYDTKGYVKHAEVLSDTSVATIIDLAHDENGAEIEQSIVGTRDLSLNITNTKSTTDQDKYKIILNKRYKDDLLVNTPIQGAKYELTIEQEYGGISTWTWDGITDENGQVFSPTFDGYGEIKIYVQELTPPDGFALDNRTYLYIFNKSRTTGEISLETQDGESEAVTKDVNGVKEINLVQRDESTKFNVGVIKTDSETGYTITDSQAQFQLTRIDNITENTDVPIDTPADTSTTDAPVTPSSTQSEVIGDLQYATTDKLGQADFLGLSIDAAGTYTYRVKELKAPDGYKLDTSELEFDVTFAQKDDGSYEITSANSHALPELTVVVYKGRTLLLKFADESKANASSFYLDVTKQDKMTKQPITSMAVFKITLPDNMPTDDPSSGNNVTNENSIMNTLSTDTTSDTTTNSTTNNTTGGTVKTGTGNSAYAETNEYGKLRYFYVGTDASQLIDLTQLPKPSVPCTLRYTLKEVSAPDGYTLYGQDIYIDIVFVQDAKGNIVIDHDQSKIATEDSSMAVIDTTDGSTSRTLCVDVYNTQSTDVPKYTVRLDVHDADDFTGELLPGAKYTIDVKQEYGLSEWQNTDTSDANGKIYTPTFDGYGDLKIEITEVSAPDGYKADMRTYTYQFHKDASTGEINLQTEDNASDPIVKDDAGNYILILTPTNVLKDNLYNFTINKTDSVTGKNICDTTTAIQLTRYNKYTGTDGKESLVQAETWTGNADNSGIFLKRGLQIPLSGGTYTYGVREVTAPTGYVIDTEERFVDITFTANSSGVLEITNVTPKSSPELKVLSNSKHSITVNFNNLNKGYYWLDITKVDGSTYDSTTDSYKPITTSSGVFKITSGTVTNLYSESSTTTGKLDYYYTDNNLSDKNYLNALKMPTTPCEIDYTIKEIKAPDGYDLYNGDIKLALTFDDLDKDGYMEIKSHTITTDDMSVIHENTSSNTDRKISFDILNTGGEALYINSSKYLIDKEVPTTGYTVGTYNEYKTGDTFIAGFFPYNLAAPTSDDNKPTTLQSIIDSKDIVTNADTIEFYDIDGTTKVTDYTQPIKTGMTMKFIKGKDSISLLTAVRGDVVERGDLRARDKQILALYITNGMAFGPATDTVYNTINTDIQKVAADVNLNGIVNINDRTRVIKAIISGAMSDLIN